MSVIVKDALHSAQKAIAEYQEQGAPCATWSEVQEKITKALAAIDAPLSTKIKSESASFTSSDLQKLRDAQTFVESLRKFSVQIPCTGNATSGVMLSWVIRGFFGSICEVYVKGAPRRIEAYNVSICMIKSALEFKSITEEEAAKIVNEIVQIDLNTVPQ